MLERRRTRRCGGAISVAWVWIEGIYMPDQPYLSFAHCLTYIKHRNSVYFSVCLSPISAASPSSISLKYITYNFTRTYFSIYLKYISKQVRRAFCQNYFPLLSQKDINIVFMPDMEIPGAKVLLSRFFCTFASQSQSLERQSRKFNKLTSVILSY